MNDKFAKFLEGSVFLADDERLPFAQEIWHIYCQAYKNIGSQHKTIHELIHDSSVWHLAWNVVGECSAVLIYKRTPFGLKGIAVASNGTKQGKVAACALMEQLNQEGFYAELSGAPERIAYKLRIAVVEARKAQEFIRHPIVPVADGMAYLRPITGVGTHRKVMFGKPKKS